MATRETEKDIRLLEAQIKNNHPGISLVIDHTHGETAVYPGAIKAQGLTVSRWDGETPYVKWEQWEITELVTCPHCGEDWKSSAIGELNGWCFPCKEELNKARDPRTDDEVRADTANKLARDLHRERWCQ